MRAGAVGVVLLLLMSTCLAGCLKKSETDSDSVTESVGEEPCSGPSEYDDADMDGLCDEIELILNTDRYNPDSDLDTAPDGWEYENGFDPLNQSDEAALVYCIWDGGFWVEDRQFCDYERRVNDSQNNSDESSDRDDNSSVMNKENCLRRDGIWIEERAYCDLDGSTSDDRENESSEISREDCERRGGTYYEEQESCEFREDSDDNSSRVTQDECEQRGGTWTESPDREGEYYCDETGLEEERDDEHDNSTGGGVGNESTSEAGNNTNDQLDNDTSGNTGNQSGNESAGNTSRTYNVLYIGHSFGRPFAQQMEQLSALAGIDHNQIIEFSGGSSGAPDMLWDDDRHRENIKEILDGGNIDVLIMICCSAGFINNAGTSDDEAVWNFTEYALEQNPQTRIGLAMPWSDFPQSYDDAEEHRNRTDMAYPLWEQMASRLSSDFGGADVFTFYHGAATYELRELFEAGNLSDVDQLRGPTATSLFTDVKGHAAQILIDTGALIWLAAIHGVDPMDLPEYEEYELDIRMVAKGIIDRYSHP